MGLDRRVLFRLATSSGWSAQSSACPAASPRAWRAASRYVAGRSRSEALAAAETLLERRSRRQRRLVRRARQRSRGRRPGARGLHRARCRLAAGAGRRLAVVDLSHLALDAGAAAVADRLAAITDALPAGRRVQVGAEELALADAILACVLAVAARGGADRLGATVQANLVRSPADADALADAGVHVRLVKGAYVEATGAHPIRRADGRGLPAPRLPARRARRSVVDGDPRRPPAGGAAARARVRGRRAAARRAPRSVGRAARRGVPTRVYVPYGPDWFRYWLRRLAESRGA